MSDESNMKMVYEGDATEANYVHNVLKDSGIKSFLKNATMGQMFPHYASAGGVVPVKLFVHQNDVEKATGIITNYIGSE